MTRNPYRSFWMVRKANNKVNRWSLEPTTYNLIFKWISGAHNRTGDYLSWVVDVKDTPWISKTLINLVVTSTLDDPATCTCIKILTPTDTIWPKMWNPHQTLTKSMHLHLSQKITGTASDKCRGQIPLQIHFKLATQWQRTFPWSWHFYSYQRSSLQIGCGLK